MLHLLYENIHVICIRKQAEQISGRYQYWK